MFKLILIASSLAIALSLNKSAFSNNVKPIALVKYKNIIYHCSKLVKTKCGHSIYCGNTTLHCADNLIVEYLK